MKIFNKFFVLSVVASLGLASCKKDFLDRKPTGQASFEDVFATTDAARAAVNGIHRMMYQFGGDQHNEFGQPSINMMWDLMGEDFIQYRFGHFNSSYNWNVALAPTATGTYMWSFYGRMINNANFIISRIDNAEGPQNDKDDIKAQALFYRAFAYYNLANCYSFSYKYVPPSGKFVLNSKGPLTYEGDVLNSPCVPLYLEPTQEGKARASVQEVYNQIEADLTESRNLFVASNNSRLDKSQIDLSVALGLSARVALVKQDWAKAQEYAREARAGYVLMKGVEVLNGFNDINNAEWMWGSAINSEQATSYASFISFLDREAEGYALIHTQMLVWKGIKDSLDASSDIRKKWWLSRADITDKTGPYYRWVACENRKFRLKVKGTWLADYPLMRASEMYLIEAEALAQQGFLVDAKNVLEEFVRTRNVDFVANTTNKQSLVYQIWFQRRIELWGEGFRYNDIKRESSKFSGVDPINGLLRTLNVGSAGTSITTIDANSYAWLWRFPSSEIVRNSLLIPNVP